MSGERCTTCDNAALSLDNAARRITELEKDRDNALSSSYVHAEMWEKAEQERDEARAEVMSLTRQRDAALAWASWWKFAARSQYSSREMEDIRGTDIQDTNQALAEVEHLRQGIEAYRDYRECMIQRDSYGFGLAKDQVDSWETSDENREVS